MATVAVIDYGMGNIRSVSKALEYAGGGARVVVSYDPDTIILADHVVFPGVGALRDCMSELHRLELDAVIAECVRTKPFLGICLGMHALFESSEENGGTAGLDLVPGRVARFSQAAVRDGLKVPHMGWNQVHQSAAHPLWDGIAQDSYFYFVHSYYVIPAQQDVVVGSTQYGISFASAIARGNIFAVQFHPEKSQHAGLALLANFLQWEGAH